MLLRLTTTATILSAGYINNASSFSTINSVSRKIQTPHKTSFVIVKSSKEDSDDWYEGYDEFVKNLDFENGGWDDNGPDMSSSYNGGRQRRGNQRQGGYGGNQRRGGYGGNQRRGGYGGGHDYTRASDDDTSVYVDTGAVETLLGERLQCRKTGEFDRADDIRDQLLGEHGVTIWDREKVWTTNRSRRGGSNRHGQNGRYGGDRGQNGRYGGDRGQNGRYGRDRSTPSRRRDFGPKGHDYRQGGGPIDTSRCTITTDQVDQLIAERLKFKMARNFKEADAIQDALRGQGIFINDGFKEWRGDGEDWDQSSRGRGGNNRNGGEFSVRQYTHRGPGLSLSEEDKELISGLVAKRAQAKATRDYDLADSVREQLTQDYSVTIDDRKCEWSLINEEYLFSPASSNPLPDDVVEKIQNQLADRSIAKQRRDFATADEIRDSLNEEYSIIIDDRNRAWSIEDSEDEDNDDYLMKLGYVEADDEDIALSTSEEEEDESEEDDEIVSEEDDFEDMEEEDDDDEIDEEIVSEAEENISSISIESLNSLTVPQLKEKLRDVGLPVSGRKAELIERLAANSN